MATKMKLRTREYDPQRSNDCSMKREALRTESETSHRITTCASLLALLEAQLERDTAVRQV